MVMEQQTPVVGKGEGVSSFVHIDDAAVGTVAALTAETGVYNLVDDDPSPQAMWLPALRSLWALSAPAHVLNKDALRRIAFRFPHKSPHTAQGDRAIASY